jgi:hypothetical protein
MNPLQNRRFRIIASIATILVVAYAIFGFFFLPGIVKSRLVEGISGYTGRKVTLDNVKINPFALSITLHELSLQDQEGEKFIGLHELYLNFEIRSLFTRAYTFSEVLVDSPFFHVKVFHDGTGNYQHLTPRDSAASDTAAPTPLVIDDLVVLRGTTIYEDRTPSVPFVATFDSLGLSLRDFTTRPREHGMYAFDASTTRGEALSWRGNISIVPLQSSGSLALTGLKARTIWEFMRDRVNYEITGGELTMHADYEFAFPNSGMAFRIRNGGIGVRSLSLIDPATKEEALSVPSLGIGGMDLDYKSRTIRIASITTEGGRLNTTRETDGNLGAKTLLLFKLDSANVKPAARDTSHWGISIDTIKLGNYTVRVSDLNAVPPAPIELSPLTLTIGHYVVGSSNPASLLFQSGINQAGTLRINGTFTDEPVSARLDMEFDGIGLVPFQPYVDQTADLTIESGSLSLKGKTTYVTSGGRSIVAFAGDVWLDNFRGTDQKLDEDFLRWDRLEVKQIRYAGEPASLSIGEIIARQAYARVIIDTNRTTNIQSIMRKAADTTKAGDTAAVHVAANSTPTTIGQIRVVDGSLNFSDLSLRPSFTIGIQQMNGTIKGLSSEELSRAVVDLEGKVDKYAPATIKGEINPLTDQAFTDILMRFENIDLTSFTPYAGKFAGYRIDKGKMTLDLRYKLNNNFLEGENKIVINQLTLGEKVEGPDVTSLPVRLAIALLKDSKGVIDLDIPVSGNINDPEFSLFPIIVKVFVNLIVKAVTAPFKLLGSLFGGSQEDLSYVEFAPGSDSLAADQKAKLTSLARALKERPALRLDIRGVSADSTDRRALASAELLRRLRGPGSTATDTTLSARDVDRLLKLYKDTFKADPEELVAAKDTTGKEIPSEKREAGTIASARSRLTAAMSVSDEDLHALARNRAAAVKNALVLQNGIDEARIFFLDVQTGAQTAADGVIHMPLSLDAR